MAPKIQTYNRMLRPSSDSLIIFRELLINAYEIFKIDFSNNSIKEYKDVPIREISLPVDGLNTWINITGQVNYEILNYFDSLFGLNQLLASGQLNTQHSLRIIENEKHTYYFSRILKMDNKIKKIVSEPITIIRGHNYILTFAQHTTDVLINIRKQLKKQISKLITLDSNYLFYTIIDQLVYDCSSLIERLRNNIKILEERFRANPSIALSNRIDTYKKDVQFIKAQTHV